MGFRRGLWVFRVWGCGGFGGFRRGLRVWAFTLAHAVKLRHFFHQSQRLPKDSAQVFDHRNVFSPRITRSAVVFMAYEDDNDAMDCKQLHLAQTQLTAGPCKLTLTGNQQDPSVHRILVCMPKLHVSILVALALVTL